MDRRPCLGVSGEPGEDPGEHGYQNRYRNCRRDNCPPRMPAAPRRPAFGRPCRARGRTRRTRRHGPDPWCRSRPWWWVGGIGFVHWCGLALVTSRSAAAAESPPAGSGSAPHDPDRTTHATVLAARTGPQSRPGPPSSSLSAPYPARTQRTHFTGRRARLVPAGTPTTAAQPHGRDHGPPTSPAPTAPMRHLPKSAPLGRPRHGHVRHGLAVQPFDAR